MRAVIRLDSSLQIGTGHLMRCLTLAEGLRERGADVEFACRRLEGSMAPLLESKSFEVREIPGNDPRGEIDHPLPDWQADAAAMERVVADSGADWVGVDHYGLDANWESAMQGTGARVFVVDDLANRRHACDLLLDQNYYRDAATRYDGLIPNGAATLLGPRYALLRPEFARYRKGDRSRTGGAVRILVFLGGTDPDNVTQKVVTALQKLPAPDLKVHVVVGGTNPHRGEIERMCSADPRFSYECQAANMAALMARSDCAVGGGGATTWERCYLGLPAIVVATAENQVRTNEDLAALGVIRYLGRARDLTPDDIADSTRAVLATPDLLQSMSAKAMAIMGNNDSLPTSRVVDALLHHTPAAAAPPLERTQ